MSTTNNRKVVLTGANRGIGQAIALAYAKAGYDYTLIARNRETLGELVARVADPRKGRLGRGIRCRL